jgi:hypothetical protein
VIETVLHLVFSGLIAFAPAKDNQSIWILLPEDHGHSPILRISEANCCGGDAAPDLWVSQSLSSEREAVFFINGSDVALAVTSPDPFVLNRGKKLAGAVKPCSPGGPTCQGVGSSYSEQKRDFGWMLEIPNVMPGSDTLNPNCLLSDPRQFSVFSMSGLPVASCSAISRLHVTQGLLQSLQLEGDEGEDEVHPDVVDTVLVRKKSPIQPERPPRAVTKKAELRIGHLSREVKIVLTPWGGGQARNIVLKPDTNGSIRVTLEHLPLQDALTGRGPVKSMNDTGGDVDHFKVFYSLSTWVPPDDLRPTLSVQPRGNLGLHGNERICPMVVFGQN